MVGSSGGTHAVFISFSLPATAEVSWWNLPTSLLLIYPRRKEATHSIINVVSTSYVRVYPVYLKAHKLDLHCFFVSFILGSFKHKSTTAGHLRKITGL